MTRNLITTLQPITTEAMTRHSANTTDGARLNIAVYGFWGGRYKWSFLDVRVFNPYAPSNRNTTIEKCFKKHEQEKKRAYEQRILDIEHASFTPLVFSASGGLGKEATILTSPTAPQWTGWDVPYHFACFDLLYNAFVVHAPRLADLLKQFHQLIW